MIIFPHLAFLDRYRGFTELCPAPVQSRFCPMTSRAPVAPKHLRQNTARWWREVHKSYQLDQHHSRLLQLAAEAWDRAEQSREALAEHGLTYSDRFGKPLARPEVAIERDARIAFARLVRELDLDAEPAPAPSRPTAIRSNRRF